MSLAVTPAPIRPTKFARMVFGFDWSSVWVASTRSTSVVPMPQPQAPTAPLVAVWLSPHATVIPGSTMPSSVAMTCTMPCCGSSTSNSLRPNARQLSCIAPIRSRDGA